MSPESTSSATDPTRRPAVPVVLFFDPMCPWTWNTSRWLVGVAEQRPLRIDWRSLSLAVLSEDQDVSAEERSRLDAGAAFHRAVAALRADGHDALVPLAYTEIGRWVHHDGLAPSVDLVRRSLAAVGAYDAADAVEDLSWDDEVRASTEEAVNLVGGDGGSPVLAIGEERAAVFGPVVSPPPTGDEAIALFDHVVGLARIAAFRSVQRAKPDTPELGARP